MPPPRAIRLAAAGTTPPYEHDLVKLYRLVEKFGFQLDDSDKAALVHFNHFYFESLAIGNPFSTRYPTDTPVGGSVPSNATFVSIIGLLIEQAEKRT